MRRVEVEAPAVAEEIEAAQIGAAPTEEHPTGDQVEIPVGVMGNLLIPHQPVIADLI